MKIHSSFISNSSSSSFVILGIDADETTLTHIGYDFNSGCAHGAQELDNDLIVVGSYSYPDIIGKNIEKDLLADKKLSEIKIEVQKSFAKFDVEVSLNDFKLVFGEWGE